jgi:hypothetical protein
MVLASLTAELSNPSPIVSSDAEGTNPVLSASSTTIKVYEGGTLLKYAKAGATSGVWTISSKEDGVGITSGSIQTVINSTTGDNYATVNNITTFTAVDNSSIKFNISGYTSLGTAFALEKVQYFTRVLDGAAFNVEIESTNGNIFRVGQSTQTILKARVFRNGEEVTETTPDSWFSWRRVSMIPRVAPDDDATWNAAHSAGFKQITISVDSVYARASFFCGIISN